MQYFELAHFYYQGFYLVSTLLLATLASAYGSTVRLYGFRKELFHSVDKPRLTPLVHRGRIRYLAVHFQPRVAAHALSADV